MVSGLRPAESKRLVQYIVRGIELAIRGLAAPNPREGFARRDVLPIPFVVECHKGSSVNEELQLDSP